MSSVWGKSLSQRNFGKEGSMPANMARKWALNVWMARLAALRRWTSGGDEEVLAGPVLLDDASVFGAGFVVEDLGGDGMPTHLEAVHDGIVGGNAVFVLTRLEGGLEDCVGVAVVGDHDVLVAAAGANGEATCVVGVELLDGFHPDVDFVGV